ncbi:MAG: hypothetical protein R3F13_11880 [Prosthecobacter sp.]
MLRHPLILKPSRPCRLWVAAWLGFAAAAQGTWQDDIGYTQLAAELGAAMPTGAGIALLQAEASSATPIPDYLPQAGGPDAFAGTSIHTGKTFHPESGEGAFANHPFSVSAYFYGNDIGVARGATEIHCYEVVDFLNKLYAGTSPPTFPGLVQNHSWVGATGDNAVDTQVLRRFDYMIERDGCSAAVPLGNGPAAMQAFMGNSYHAISAGLLSGSHSLGGTNVDGSGRMKPDLVVNEGQTSYASPVIAGCVAALLESAGTANASARKPQVIKALLLAGASKRNLPQWQRDSDAQPYDDVFGAGEVNLRNAYYIQQGGQQTYSTSVERSRRGWDYATTTTSATGRRYFFSVPAGQYARTFSAALIWHRSLVRIAGSYTSSLANLNLRLYATDNFAVVGGAIGSSISAVDNVEHLHFYNLPPGQYAIEVTAGTLNQPYALAWDATLSAGPQLASHVSEGQLWLDASNLDPLLTYTIEAAPSPTGEWMTEHTFRTADTTASFSYSWQAPAPAGTRRFYRLQWTPVR